MLKLRSGGRGRNYSLLRGIGESALDLLYTGGWAASLWQRFPGSTHVKLLSYRLPLLPAGLSPLRIAFASDLHLGPTTPPRLLDEAFALLERARPDVLLLGGDYVFLEATPEKAAELSALVARVPAAQKFAVFGNHDLWTDHDLLGRALERAGVRLLVNESLHLRAPHGEIAIVGLDDPWTGTPDPDAAFAECADAALAIALCHAPEAQPLLAGRSAKLLFCGHTHGGHIAAPWGPIVVPGPLSRRFCAGLYDVDDITLFVSRGIGGIEVAPRLFAPPDVAVIELYSPSEGSQ